VFGWAVKRREAIVHRSRERPLEPGGRAARRGYGTLHLLTPPEKHSERTQAEACTTLERPIGPVRATAMVAGIIIGASIFVQPSEINRHVPSVAGVLSVWIAAGMLTLFGALVCAEFSSALPLTGGVYVFLKETLSPWCGFLWGWAMFWSAHSGIIAASAVILARYVAYFVPMDDAGIRMTAIAGILLLSYVNHRGVRQGSMLQTVVTVTKVAAIAVLLVMVFAAAPPPDSAVAHAAAPPVPFREFVLAVSAALFTYGGWHMVTYTAGETRAPEKTIPRSLVAGSLIVTVCYVALNSAYLYLLPLEKVVTSKRVAADAAQAMAGVRGGAIVSALVILSASGVLNGVILAGPRTYFAMADDGMGFAWMRWLHPRFHTPSRTIALQAAWSCVLVATGTYRALYTRVVYTEWLFFALMGVGLYRLRARPGYRPVFRMWGYRVVPLLFIAASVVVAVIQIAADPAQSAAGLAIVVLGLPVYFLIRTKHANH
jgi:APA family basic amino acid/polyamine antiporter